MKALTSVLFKATLLGTLIVSMTQEIHASAAGISWATEDGDGTVIDLTAAGSTRTVNSGQTVRIFINAPLPVTWDISNLSETSELSRFCGIVS